MAKEIFSAKPLINVKGNLFDLSIPKVMGIANATPDSFYSLSRVSSAELEDYIGKMVQEGVDFIDVGGYSSRPGAEHISEKEEIERVLPLLEAIVSKFDIPVSIDTFRSSVAREAVNAGAGIINDISAGQLDEKMFETVAELGVPYIMMHMRGNPQTMQKMTDYGDVIMEMIDYFQIKLKRLNEMGVTDVILDPGFGFAKTLDQNYEILRKLEYFKVLERPMLVGLSRKSMIFRYLEIQPDESLLGTGILNSVALGKGASILRVHDVKAAKQTISLNFKLEI